MSEKNEWEIRRDQATETWANLHEHQREAILELLKSWVPIRSRVGELCSLDYDDLRAVDNAWWKLLRAVVDKDVKINEWDY